MQALTIGEAAAHTGWSARMLRYLESVGLVVPTRTRGGYRVYGDSEPALRTALDSWMRSAGPGADWVEWEQRKHERLISAA
jgi:DNA-binding transcriptional MerR regulator